MKGSNVKEITNVIDTKTLQKMAFRSFMLQSSFNYERMQAGGWTYSLIPGLEKIYTDKEELAVALKDHMQFFNTNPHIVSFMQGVVIAMEQNSEDRNAIQGVKVGMMGPLGGIGDALFHLTLLPISAGIGASLALNGSAMGPVVFLLLYNIPYIFVKFSLITVGYNAGVKAIESMSENTKRLSRAGAIVGLSVVGALVAKTVNFSLAYIIKAGQVEVNLQEDLFDAIMPAMLPLAITILFFNLIRKRVNPIKIILATVVFALIGSFFGIV